MDYGKERGEVRKTLHLGRRIENLGKTPLKFSDVKPVTPAPE